MAWLPALSTRALTVLGLSLAAFSTAACGGPAKPAETAGADSATQSAGAAAIGAPAPDLSIQTLNGRGTISLSSLAGKIAIVEFFSKSCVPCKKSFPALDELAKKSDGRIKVVAIATDDAKDGVLQFASINGASFPIAWDEGHTVAQRWKVDKAPTSYVLDGSGTVRFVHENYGDDEQELLTRELAFLNSEPPPSTGGNAVASSGSSQASGGPSPFDSKSAGGGGGAGKASASEPSPSDASGDEAPVATKPGKGGKKAGGAGKAKPAKKAGGKKKKA